MGWGQAVILNVGRTMFLSRTGSATMRAVLLAISMLGLLVILVACVSSPASRGTANPGTGPRLVFQEKVHDFGKISSNQSTQYQFAFSNMGSKPLQLQEIKLAPAKPGG